MDFRGLFFPNVLHLNFACVLCKGNIVVQVRLTSGLEQAFTVHTDLPLQTWIQINIFIQTSEVLRLLFIYFTVIEALDGQRLKAFLKLHCTIFICTFPRIGCFFMTQVVTL